MNQLKQFYFSFSSKYKPSYNEKISGEFQKYNEQEIKQKLTFLY